MDKRIAYIVDEDVQFYIRPNNFQQFMDMNQVPFYSKINTHIHNQSTHF